MRILPWNGATYDDIVSDKIIQNNTEELKDLGGKKKKEKRKIVKEEDIMRSDWK